MNDPQSTDPQSTDPQSTIAVAKADFLRARATLTRSLDTTPDDQIGWSPSPTSRSPLGLFAHAADSVRHLHNTFAGIVFPIPTSAEGDRSFREWEREFTTRAQVEAVMEANASAYLAWLDALDSDRLDVAVEFPYGMGRFPIRLGLTFVPMHTLWHAAQIDYVQTIYGDRDWHTGF